MQTACSAILTTARDLLDHGVLNEGARSLVDLRRCAHSLGCPDWQECRCRIDDAWQVRDRTPCPSLHAERRLR